MAVRLTVHFEFGSPYTFLAWHRIHHHPAYRDIEVLWRPMSLWHIVQREGGKLNRELPNLLRTNREDVARFARAYGVRLRIAPSWPTVTLPALRAHFVAADQGKDAAWRKAVFEAHWLHQQDIGDPSVLAALAGSAGVEGLVDALQDPAVKQRLVDATDEAYAAGACGAPFLVLDTGTGTERYWGNDRLDWVEARLAGQEAPAHWHMGPT